jgi:Na+/phosphate symporter
LGIIPGVICGILGGIINAVFFYYTFDQMSQKRVIIFGGVWGFVVGALLLIPFIGVFEFYATLPSGAVGGLIGSASTNWILWNYLISEVSS